MLLYQRQSNLIVILHILLICYGMCKIVTLLDHYNQAWTIKVFLNISIMSSQTVCKIAPWEGEKCPVYSNLTQLRPSFSKLFNSQYFLRNIHRVFALNFFHFVLVNFTLVPQGYFSGIVFTSYNLKLHVKVDHHAADKWFVHSTKQPQEPFAKPEKKTLQIILS